MATVPGEDHEGVKQRLVDWIVRAAAEDPWMREHSPKVRFVGHDARASEIPQDHPIVTTVARNYREVTGRRPEMSGRQGAADTRLLNEYGNTPTVIFGPGSIAVMHSDDACDRRRDYLRPNARRNHRPAVRASSLSADRRARGQPPDRRPTCVPASALPTHDIRGNRIGRSARGRAAPAGAATYGRPAAPTAPIAHRPQVFGLGARGRHANARVNQIPGIPFRP